MNDFAPDISKKFAPLKRLIEHKNQLDLFSIVEEQAKISFLDLQKKYAIVEVKYLEELQSIAKQNQRKIDQHLGKTSHEFAMNSGLLKAMEFQQKETQVLSQNEKKLRRQIDHLNEKIAQLEAQKEEKVEENLNLFNELTQIKAVQSKKISQIGEMAIKVDQDQQTQYVIPIIEFTKTFKNKNLGLIRENRIFTNEQEQLKQLRIHFENMVRQVKEQLQNKVLELRNATIEIEIWEKKNAQLVEENQNLRSNLLQIDEKKEKINHWKEKLARFWLKLEDGVEKCQMVPEDRVQEENQVESAIIPDKERIQKLEQKLLVYEMEKKVAEKQLKQLFCEQEEIPEENIITKLVATSSKVKEVVKYLTEHV